MNVLALLGFGAVATVVALSDRLRGRDVLDTVRVLAPVVALLGVVSYLLVARIPTDVNQILAFGREKLARKILLFAAIAFGVGVLSLLVGDEGDAMLPYVGWGLIVFGAGFAAWEFAKTTQKQKPLLVLSPQGIHMYLEGATEFDIPWSEVHGIDSITVEGLRGAVFENVTVVLVTRDFYDRVIHVDSFIRRGPGWGSVFIPHGDMIQVAFHHEFLPVTASDLLAAVEARYRAFGNRPDPEPRA